MKKTIFSLFFLLVLSVAFSAQAAIQVTATWSPNTEGDLAGYNIYRSTTSGSGFTKINSSIITKTATPQYHDNINGTIDATYYYVVTAVDTSGNESAHSNQGSIHIDTSAPAPPNGVTVHIQ